MPEDGLRKSIIEKLLDNIVALPFVILGGLILGWFLQDARFDPTRPDNLPPDPTATTFAFNQQPDLTTPPNVALGVGSTQTSTIDGMEQVYVPAGTFMMGSEDGLDDESPMHEVYLDAFWIDKYEVTNDQFATFLNEMGNQTTGGVTWLDLEGTNRINSIVWEQGQFQPKSGSINHPVIHVNWYGARAYCQWVGRRLPTEAEWEKAARGEDRRIYPWGNDFDMTLLNATDDADGFSRIAPVGNYPEGASPYGAMDMAGNVWEWVSDWFDQTYYRQSPARNPQGTENGEQKVSRGGSWNNDDFSVRSAFRLNINPTDRNYGVGFRCAQTVQSP